MNDAEFQARWPKGFKVKDVRDDLEAKIISNDRNIVGGRGRLIVEREDGYRQIWRTDHLHIVTKRGEDKDSQTPCANPKQQYGDKKPPLQLIHSIALLHESAAMHAGKLKYGENNYIDADVETMTYAGAMRRHLDQYMAGETYDEKERVHHLGAIRACAGILLTAEACGTLIDNRPRVGGTGGVQVPRSPRSTYRDAFQKTFDYVSGVVEHLNKLYPAKLG